MDNKKKTYLGRVLSDRMDKTVVVEVETRRPHPRYKRVVTFRRRFKAHDESNACDIGDLVKIVETRPLSREKRWRVVAVVSRGKAVEVKPKEIGAEIIEVPQAEVEAETEVETRAEAEAKTQTVQQ